MKNILNKTKSYLIGSMQYGNGEEWRNDLGLFLRSRGVVVMDPYKKAFVDAPEETPEIHEELGVDMEAGLYDRVADHMKVVRALDLSMVDRSDFIICYLNPEVPTYGTVEELANACRMKRPTFIVVEGGKSKTPLWVMGMFPHRYIYDDFESLKSMIASIDDGGTVIDSDRWRLFKPEFR